MEKTWRKMSGKKLDEICQGKNLTKMSGKKLDEKCQGKNLTKNVREKTWRKVASNHSVDLNASYTAFIKYAL